MEAVVGAGTGRGPRLALCSLPSLGVCARRPCCAPSLGIPCACLALALL